MAALFAAYGGQYKFVNKCRSPRRRTSSLYLLTTINQKRIAIIECAAIIGIQLLDPSDQTTRQASSYGLGLLIADAINEKVAQIYVTLGGSANNRWRTGFTGSIRCGTMYQPAADARNPLLTINYFSITAVQKPLSGIELLVLADVTNPYTGAEGFAQLLSDLRKVLLPPKRYRHWSSKQKKK